MQKMKWWQEVIVILLLSAVFAIWLIFTMLTPPIQF